MPHLRVATVQSNNDDKLKGMLEQLALTISIPLTIYMMLLLSVAIYLKFPGGEGAGASRITQMSSKNWRTNISVHPKIDKFPLDIDFPPPMPPYHSDKFQTFAAKPKKCSIWHVFVIIMREHLRRKPYLLFAFIWGSFYHEPHSESASGVLATITL